MLKIRLLLNRVLAGLLIVLVLTSMGVMIFTIYDLDTKSNIKIIELKSEIKTLENQLIVQNATITEFKKINIELLQIPDYLRDDYQKQISKEFISAEKFLNEIDVLIPTIFTSAIKGEIKDNSSFTIYGQVPYAESTVTGTIFRGDINKAAIIDIFQIESNEYGQYSHDITINSEQLWRTGNYTLSIQNAGIFNEVLFTYK